MRHTQPPHYSPGRRRTLYLLGTALAGGGALLATPAWAGGAAWDRVEPARALLDGAAPRTGAITLEMPAITMDGSAVPITVEVHHPMTADDYVEAVYLFAAENPYPLALEVALTPLAGSTRLSTRVRLNGSPVIALARTSGGEWLAASRDIRVTSAGCLLAESLDYDEETIMTARVRAPAKLTRGTPGEVISLINHPMQTGLHHDDDGNPIPKRIIQRLSVDLDGEPVLRVRFHRSISANPYLRFFIAPERSGELALEWEEDTGRKASQSAPIEVG